MDLVETSIVKANKNKLIRLLFLATLFGFSACQQQSTTYEPQVGDLLFQDLDCGDLCDAIETVTEGVDGRDFSHVGIISDVDEEGVWVMEAIGKGVQQTTYEDFLDRNRDESAAPKVLVGRLKAEYQKLTPKAIEHIQSLQGSPYDNLYTIGDSTYYCSELIYEGYKEANQGESIFQLFPMTFIDPATNRFFPAWINYYADFLADIPEGKPGLNPGGMSRSDKIEVVHAFY